MLSKKMALLVFLLAALSPTCTAPTPDQLPIVTPKFTPEIPRPTETLAGIVPTTTETPTPTSIPRDAISPDNLEQVQLLHEYWQTVANAAGVDPYEMDISAIAASSQGRYLAVGGCSKPVEADLRSGNIYCNGADPQGPEGIPFLLILDTSTENVIGAVPENEPGTTVADLAFTYDGEKLIYAVHPGRFAIWDISSGQIETALWEGDTSTPRIAASPDGKWIALKTSDRVIIWDTASEGFVAEIPAYFRPEFSAESDRMLVYRDERFIVYETATWIELLSFGIPCDCVYAFSPDFSLFAALRECTSRKCTDRDLGCFYGQAAPIFGRK